MNSTDKLVNDTLVFIAQKGWTRNGKVFYDSLSLFLAEKLNVAYVLIDKLLPDGNNVEAISFVAFNEVKTNVSYPLLNTPCENVMGRNLCCYPKNVKSLFPLDSMLVDMKADSYIGIPLWNTKGEPIGLIALLDTKPIENSEEVETILQIVAVRVAHEIERNVFEDSLIEKNKKLEEADRLKSAFLANMSHEIRTPMNAIIGFSSLLNDTISNEKRKHFVDLINKRSHDLLNIINDILDISRIESNQLNILESEFDLNVLINEIYQTFKAQNECAVPQLVEFRLITDCNEVFKIKTDLARLKQVIVNLLGNAFKFTEHGHVDFGYTVENNSIIFFVSDTGIGIHPTKHELIFDRFRQADDNRTAQAYGGTGLGLSIAKGIISLLGGKIWVDSAEGSGANFLFSVPFKPVSASKPFEINNSKTLLDWKELSILIIEDDVYNSEFICEVLNFTNAKLIRAYNGETALEILKNNSAISIILMDIKLPDLNGYEITKQALKINPKLKIIAQTAYASSAEKERCLNSGFCGFISKPIKRDELVQLIENIK